MSRLVLFSSIMTVLALVVLGSAEEKTKADLSKLPAAAAGTMDFQRDIQPILSRACLSCHGATKQRGGLRLDSGAEAQKGGDSGGVIKPGDAAQSKLLHLVAGLDPELQMPPEKKNALSAQEIGKLRAWIEQGAKFPQQAAGATADGPRSTHWAFQPPKRPAVPVVVPPPLPPGERATTWVQHNPIDNFIQARLSAAKLQPNPEADRVTLIRRLSLDLLGLPPAPEEVEAFLNDTQPGAYERVVDRLLASQHYGERWGRHWLDLARYADSDGYEKDTGRPYAWRFRHWVIDALNRDLPFDRFTIEQLAGDLLPGATLEQKTATGFHRNTLTNKEGGVDQEQFRVEAVVDRVNTTGKVWLGITMGCCQCHDHKYDPFSQREYYQFFAFFNSDAETDLPAPLPGEEESFNRKKAEFDRKKAELQAAVTTYQKDQLPAALDKWEVGLKTAQLKELPVGILDILGVEPKQRLAKQDQELLAYYSKVDQKLIELTKAVTAHERTAPQQSKVMSLALGSNRKTNVLIRGDFLRPGVEVQAATPAVLPSLKGQGSAKPTRLELAQWLVGPDNPLTARVAVNWIWHKYFGRGIVPTLEDFGTQGEKPAHPELLDWLATEFVRQDWSLKAFHRLVVSSASYRQSSRMRPELLSRDPSNVLVARQVRQRLEGEVLRDASLASSGLLTRRVGGPSVRPPQPPGISELTYANSAKWVESTGADRYRRGLYTWFQRTSPYPMLMTFDSPDGNVSCVRRDRTNTPLQALTLLNDTAFVECAQALGKRIIEERPGADPKERIRHGFRLCVARMPTGLELERLGVLYNDLLQMAKARPEEAVKLIGKDRPMGVEAAEAAAWVALARLFLNLDEFVTRE